MDEEEESKGESVVERTPNPSLLSQLIRRVEGSWRVRGRERGELKGLSKGRLGIEKGCLKREEMGGVAMVVEAVVLRSIFFFSSFFFLRLRVGINYCFVCEE